MREVSLVRQDVADCPNDNVSDQDPSRVGGTVILMRNTDGTTTVKVGITAAPNTRYNFFLKCVRILGTVQTYDEGEGRGALFVPHRRGQQRLRLRHVSGRRAGR